ncbi:MAG: flagellar hook-basal body complex protein [Ruminococcus sp.]|jgi:flagellar basal-body rod protein FlgG|nr:flagellar hook-basal body complex protein [Ruminococcus sp.]
MLRGYYIAANGLYTEQRIIDTIANNMANVNTVGYKSDTAIDTTFGEAMVLLDGRRSDGYVEYRSVDVTETDLTQGVFDETGSNLDIALDGQVYFNIQVQRGDNEILLTKAGDFNIDAEGYLALGDSGRVCDENGQPILLNTSYFTVGNKGLITTEDGREFQLGLTYIEDAADVEKVRDNLFRPYNGEALGNIPEDLPYRVRQGYIERSNASLAELQIAAQSHQGVFTACATALKVMQQINSMAVRDFKIN